MTPPTADSPRMASRAPAPPAGRLVSLDVFRGVTMLFMASEILHIPSVVRGFPDSAMARWLVDNLDHRTWVGCNPWDLIQPAFMFMVGVALPFSLASRRAKGQLFGRMFAHSAWRAVVLVALGIFLRSQGRPQTYFTFEDVLTQIGLGYVVLFLLGWTRPRTQAIAAGLVLVGYWAAFALYPLPPVGFDTATVGVPAGWAQQLTGFAAHWNKNTNLAHAADVWFLNLFPREQRFLYNGGGYLTLNFIPSLATMIFGLLAGGLLKDARPGMEKVRWLIGAGLAGLLAGWLLHALGLSPLVKRIWTPSWTLFSAGWVALMLAAYYYVIDLRGYRRWASPFLVVGMNSIMMYVLVHIGTDYVTDAFVIHLGVAPFNVFGEALAPVLLGAAALLVFWSMLWWMHSKKLFLRI